MADLAKADTKPLKNASKKQLENIKYVWLSYT